MTPGKLLQSMVKFSTRTPCRSLKQIFKPQK
jgi:hypothetical protein